MCASALGSMPPSGSVPLVNDGAVLGINVFGYGAVGCFEVFKNMERPATVDIVCSPSPSPARFTSAPGAATQASIPSTWLPEQQRSTDHCTSGGAGIGMNDCGGVLGLTGANLSPEHCEPGGQANLPRYIYVFTDLALKKTFFFGLAFLFRSCYL